MPDEILITCEHAGNETPQEYNFLFKGKEEALYSHKAIDFGALDLARKISDILNAPLFYTSITRLLVEANRSEDNQAIFSDFSRQLNEEQKKDVLEKHYRGHRNEVEAYIRDLINKGKRVIHIAAHTFTPVLEGEVRAGDVGILFDPSRSEEKAFFDLFKSRILSIDDSLIVLENFPYPGIDDGFPTYLRKKFTNETYVGIELEVNQKYYLSGEMEKWELVKATIAAALLTIKQAI